MKKEQLTKEIKNEGVDEMRRDQLERKLNEGQELTREESRELKQLIRIENFFEDSEKALTLDEVALIKDITGISRISSKTVTALSLELQEQSLDEVINKDFVEQLSMIIAKVQNILSKPELIECEAYMYKLDKEIEVLTKGTESLEDLPKDKFEEFKSTFEMFRNEESYREFIINSYMPLTEDEIITMSNALNEEVTRKNAKNYLEDLEEIAYESTWIDGEGNNSEEYTNELNLIVAKLKNM